MRDIAFILLTGVVYPLAVMVAAQVAFPDRANGSLVERNGSVVGSSLLGQSFTGAEYFHLVGVGARPSYLRRQTPASRRLGWRRPAAFPPTSSCASWMVLNLDFDALG